MKPDSNKVAKIREALPQKFKGVRLTDDDFVDALYALIFDLQSPVITIMGPGGTGKSFMYKLFAKVGEKCLCTATTGIAAFNLSSSDIATCTLHSALDLKPLPWFDDTSINKKLVNKLMRFQNLLIDEVSMLNANLLDYILAHIEVVNRKKREDGEDILRLILFGDTLQLPPVIKDTDSNIIKLWKSGYCEKYMFFNAKRYNDLDEEKRPIFFLDEIFRQDDADFKAMLNEIRLGNPSDSTLEKLNRHVIPIDEFKAKNKDKQMLYLTTTNSNVDKINMRESEIFLSEGKECHTYRAREEGKPDWKYYFSHLKKEVTIFIGQQVMCIANNEDEGYQNGTIGIVIGFKKIENENSTLYLPIVRNKAGREFVVCFHEFTEYKVEGIKGNRPTAITEKGKITQIGCKVAFASTVHKSQGLTLDAIYYEPSRRTMPNSVYVALSRLKTLDGLGLKRKLAKEDIVATDESIWLYKKYEALYPD